MGIRYIFQAMVMFSDIAIIIATAVLLYLAPQNPVVWTMIVISLKVWHGQGGFIAWKPNNIRMFMAEMKKSRVIIFKNKKLTESRYKIVFRFFITKEFLLCYPEK